jgi:cysteine desulfurase
MDGSLSVDESTRSQPVTGDNGFPILYFDHASSAPRRPEVLDAMARFGVGVVGNPSGSHRAARAARTALDDAREEIAALTGSLPGGVVFTAGGTESCNTAIFGVIADKARRGKSARVAVSAIEHSAVLGAAERLEGLLATEVTTSELAVTRDGVLDVARLDEAIPGADLVSVMTANNETGVIQPIAELVAYVHEHAPTAVVHTDAVAAAPWLDLAQAAAGADLVSIAAHKLGGPVGAGALCFRREVALAPLFVGGGQERGRRAGTQDVAAAVGLALSLRLTLAEQAANAAEARSRRDRLNHRLVNAVRGVHVTTPGADVLPGTCHFLVEGVENEALVQACDDAGLCVSAAVSCASGSTTASYVLLAMGISEQLARGSLRLTFGTETTDADVDRAAEIVADAITRLRGGRDAD